MNRHLYRAYIKTLQWLVPVRRINFDCETVEVDFGGEGDYAEYNFDEIVLEHCTGLVAAKSYRGDTEADRLVFEGDILRIFGGSTSEVIGILGWCQHDQCYVVFKDINANEHIFDFGNFDSSEYAEIISTIHDEGSAE